MIVIRQANDRGHSKHDWLDSRHTFSFADYYDPNYTGFGNLLVINEDTVQPGMGFGMHSHNNMEIISYVVTGELEHKDSMGTGSVIKPGEIQKMSAGSGVRHSEFNHSPQDTLHFLQIWIVPNQKNIVPSYEQKKIPRTKMNQWLLIGSPATTENAVTIHQAVDMYVAYLTQNFSIDYFLKDNHSAWLQVVKGDMSLNGFMLSTGDGVAIKAEQQLNIQGKKPAEILLFDFVDSNPQ